MTQETIKDLTLKELDQFFGSENYYKILGYNVTDGVFYVMQNGYSWFITDFLSLIVTNHKGLRNQEFLSINLKKDGNKWFMIVTDGNENVLYKQKYLLTDAQKEINLYFCNGVLMLSNEY